MIPITTTKENPNSKINKNKRKEEGQEPMDTAEYPECSEGVTDAHEQTTPDKGVKMDVIVADILSDELRAHQAQFNRAQFNRAQICLTRCDNRKKEDLMTVSDPEIRCQDNDIDSDTDREAEIMYRAGLTREGRGRRPKGKEYYKKQIRDRKKEERQEGEHEEYLEGLFDESTDVPELPHTKTTDRWIEIQEEKGKYFQMAGTTEITAILTEKHISFIRSVHAPKT